MMIAALIVALIAVQKVAQVALVPVNLAVVVMMIVLVMMMMMMIV